MEKRNQEEIDVSTSHQTTGTLALKNFTIPRKKRTSGEVVLERCPKESRDYTLIQSKLRDSRLDTRKNSANTWIWKDVHLVHNDQLLQRFSEKRAEMRAKGRHGREMEERFCFLVASDQDTAHIYQDGLKVGSSVQHALGKPTHGVYLFRHVDVALKSTTSASVTNLLIFKVLYGKVKKIAQNLTWKKSQDPVVGFDCHMSKDVVSPRDAPQQQALGSSVFLFDFNENQELSERPRQCLVYAIVSYAPSCIILDTPLNLPFSSTSHDAADNFQACTVAQRRGKGNTATITFKHFGTSQNPEVEYLFQKADVQNTQAPDSRHHLIRISQNSVLHHTTVSQNLLQEEANHKQNTADTQETLDKCDTMPPSPFDKVSTIVYSSRSVRDPRLSRREINQQSCSEAETSCTASRSDDEKWPSGSQNQNVNSAFVTATAESSPKEQSHIKCSLQCSLNKCVHTQKQKAETLPSIKLFKMKFQKYAKYFRLNEEERHNRIWSLENMSPEQKRTLLDRIQFYEVYYQKYKKGLLCQNVNRVETEKISSVSLKEPREHHIFDVSQTTNNEADNSLDKTCFVYSSKKYNRDSDTYIIQSKHQSNPEHCAVMLPENRQDQEYVQLNRNGFVSKPFSEAGSLNLTDEKTDSQIEQHAPTSCPFREGKTNHNIKCQSEPSTGTGEDSVNESGLVDLDERPSHKSVIIFADNITAMDIASLVEVSSYGLSENSNPNSATAESRVQDGRNFQDRNSSSQDSISPELNMATLQENSSIHLELYQRLQLDELFPNQTGKQIFSSSVYLTPRVTTTDTKDQSKTEPHLMVTLKGSKTPGHTAGTIALSERFSKLESCRKRVAAFVKENIETGSSNVELIKLLAKRYNKANLHGKCRSLNKPQTSALARSLRTKYVNFWKSKKCLVSTKSSHEVVCYNPSHTSKIDLPESTNQEPDYNLRNMSDTSDAACDEQQLHIKVSQETNENSNLSQDDCGSINDLMPSLGFKTSSETKEEETKPAEPLLLDSFCTKVNKPSDDSTPKNISNDNRTSLNKHASSNDISQDYNSTFTEEGSVLQEVTSHMTSDPLARTGINFEELSDGDNVKASENSPSFSHPTKLLPPESKVICDFNDTIETEPLCEIAVDNIETSEKNIPHKTQSGLTTSTNMNSGAWAINTETVSQVEVLMKEGSSDLQHSSQLAWKDTSNNAADLTDKKCSSSGHCEHLNSINTSLLAVGVSDTKHANAAIINENCHFSRPEQNQNYDVDSPETQLISKLRDYLTKFESTVKKQESVNEGLREKPVVWITLDSTAHKQQLADKGQYRSNDEALTGPDVYLLVPAESKRGRSSQTKRHTSRHKLKRARWSLCPSVSPDSTSALDTVKETSPQPSVNSGTAAPAELSIRNEPKTQLLMQSEESTSSNISSQGPENTCGNGELKPQTTQVLDMTGTVDDDVSSSFVSSDFSVSDILNTLKMADQTSSLTELESLRSKCENMLQQFTLRFEQDQKIPFNQSFVSRNLIIEQYLDHPPAHLDLKYAAVNSYLELQMMMEAWQFVENKINFLRGKPTFRSLLWYDPSLYGELYKGEVGFQQQSSLFTSFQKMLVQEGYTKLQEYYMTVSRMYQQLLVNPDASYYMYLKSKREVLEIEAALRNPHDIKYFFLSVPLTAMINFGDRLENLENVHKVIMTFVETPSDQLPGTFDVGKAEHLSITCRYLQEKAFFIRSCKETLTKVSWFGIEHLLYDASKILIWQDADHRMSNEVLKMYKNSNPQIIFGVTESGVTLVNKVKQPRLSTDGAETSAEKQSAPSLKHKPSQSSDLQTIMEADYTMCKRRETHPVITPHPKNDNGANPLYRAPSAHAGNSSPYHIAHQNITSVHWGMMNRSVLDWNTPSPSTPHVHSEIKTFLSKRRARSSHSDHRISLPDAQRVQPVMEQKWPLMSTPQTTSQADSFVRHPRFESVIHQQASTSSHCLVPSKEQANRLTVAMAPPFSLPNFPPNANFVAPPSLSVPNSLTRVPVPSMLPAINYPYFLLNGQTYTTDSTAAVHPYTRYYSNTI